jgi:alpha-beta hydrolase superfamily lysophospholipase
MDNPDNSVPATPPAEPRLPGRRRKIIIGLLAGLGLGLGLDWEAGSLLIAPHQGRMERPAGVGYTVESVAFPSASGAVVQGWLVPAPAARGTVILMHGVRADRRTLLNRVRFLHEAGYAALLFDFQAHGETPGKHITFGYLESRDAAAAVTFIRQKHSGEKIAVLGISMGGSAALLAQPPLAADALIVESAYPTIEQAVEDRLMVRFGPWGKYGAPLLTWQLKPRLGIGVEDLRPIRAAGRITAPKFFLAGSADRLTTLPESQALYDAAAGPKQLWIVPGAQHEDLHEFAPAEYEKRVLAFLAENLK